MLCQGISERFTFSARSAAPLGSLGSSCSFLQTRPCGVLGFHTDPSHAVVACRGTEASEMAPQLLRALLDDPESVGLNVGQSRFLMKMYLVAAAKHSARKSFVLAVRLRKW